PPPSASTYSGQRSSDFAGSEASISSTGRPASTGRSASAYSSRTSRSTTKWAAPRPSHAARFANGVVDSNSTTYGPLWEVMVIGSDTREAAVDHEILSADVGVLAAGQPRHEGRDLRRLREALHRDACRQLGHPGGPDNAAGEFGIDEAGRDAVGEDSVARELRRQRRRGAIQAELA